MSIHFFIPKFKISAPNLNLRFERYVNFEFYKTYATYIILSTPFERYVNFEFYKTVEFEKMQKDMFERYVNFEFYKTPSHGLHNYHSLRDM